MNWIAIMESLAKSNDTQATVGLCVGLLIGFVLTVFAIYVYGFM